MLWSLPANFSLISFLSLSASRLKIFAIRPSDENVFAFVLRSAAQRLDRQTCDGNSDINETFVVEVRFDVVGIVKQHAAFAQEIEVVLITVLIKRDEKIGFIAG